jgi:cytochrome c oxidase assembly protein subunit 15
MLERLTPSPGPRRFTFTPRGYRRIADAALASLTIIVLSGAAVRVTGSGLGCPDWPVCRGGLAPPLELHTWVEYGNRLFTGVVAVACIAAGVLAWRRRPFRRDLMILGLLLPLGVVAQAVLGGFTVLYDLAPGFVMGHYGLSMLCLAAACALSWRARYEPGERPRSTDAVAVWGSRALVPLAAVAIFLGTVASAAGPHGGGAGTGDVIDRLEWWGGDSIVQAVHWHGRLANLLGIAAVIGFLVLRRRGAPREHLMVMGVLCALLAVQGVVGVLQFWVLGLPAELVWIHVVLATATWLVVLWNVGVAGSLAPRRAAPAPERPREAVRASA